MNRRKFISRALTAGGGLVLGETTNPRLQASRPSGDDARRASHRLPETDVHYRKVRSYVEEIPVPEYHWAPESAYEAFRDIKYGVRLHWGLYSTLQWQHESWPFLKLSFPERQSYQNLYQTWNPRDFDADAWMSLFAESGLKMFAFTTKHHDGFSMYDTKTRVRSRVNWVAPGGPKIESCDLPYSIMETPFRRDVVRELCNAARKRGLKIDLYFSHPDWYDADFRPYALHPLQVPSSNTLTLDWEDAKKSLGDRMVLVDDPTPEETRRMVERHRAQLVELLSNYGEIDMMCLDQWLGPSMWPHLRETILKLRQIQPNVMFRARGIGNYGDYYTPENFVPSDKDDNNVPWFVIYPLGYSFSYDPVAKNYKGAEWIVRNLVDAVSKGGNFMVGIGPDGAGKFHPTAAAQLKEAGSWLKINGQGIYETRPRKGTLYKEGEEIRYTQSKDHKVVYAFSLSWPGQELNLRTVRPRENSKISMLGQDKPLNWRIDSDRGLVIELPGQLYEHARGPSRLAYCFRIENLAPEGPV
jgi:alpha-L-fucosidase